MNSHEKITHFFYNYKFKHHHIKFMSVKDNDYYFDIYDKNSAKISDGKRVKYFNIDYRIMVNDFLKGVNRNNLNDFKKKYFENNYYNKNYFIFNEEKNDSRFLLSWNIKNCLDDKGNIYDYPGIIVKKDIGLFTFVIFLSQGKEYNSLSIKDEFLEEINQTVNDLEELVNNIDQYA